MGSDPCSAATVRSSSVAAAHSQTGSKRGPSRPGTAPVGPGEGREQRRDEPSTRSLDPADAAAVATEANRTAMGNHHEGHAFVRSFAGLGLFGIRAVHAVGVTRMTPRL